MRIFLVLDTFYSDENDEKVKLTEIFTFLTIFGTGNRIFGQKYIGERIFLDHILTKMHIFAINQHLKMVEG